MDHHITVLSMHRQSFEFFFDCMDSLQQQNQTILRTWIGLSGIPLGERTDYHLQRWHDLFNRTTDDARDTANTILEKIGSRIPD
ncbi:hypothetical protein OOT00_10535 [Desulfobotulus sp. H1]|uniref:Uncharacterized protein n=1 Tax=Desulfobotulus pelophilus TaxID=2823377 RepID=A0ABT3NAD4_9BACT|nr:hypothetical protein [Desulfobotulus pelophilus]MCW7754422.1 hypothetical protein [Desulfobotulus pelophilus]